MVDKIKIKKGQRWQYSDVEGSDIIIEICKLYRSYDNVDGIYVQINKLSENDKNAKVGEIGKYFTINPRQSSMIQIEPGHTYKDKTNLENDV